MLSLQRSFERASQTAAELPRIPQLEPLYRNQDMHIHKGDLVMIAGRSGSQKSGLAMFITAMLNQPALYISGDMTPWEASTRIISLNTQHTTTQIQHNIDNYGPEYYRDSIHHGQHITFSFQSPITWTDITMELQAYMEMWNTFPPIIVIDNLMDIQDCESDYQAQQEAMQWITALGRDTGSTIIVTHHATDKTGTDIEHPPARREIKNGLSEKPQLILGVSFYGGEDNGNGLTIPAEARIAVLKQRTGKSSPDGTRYERLRAYPEYTFFGPLAEKQPWNMTPTHKGLSCQHNRHATAEPEPNGKHDSSTSYATPAMI